MGDIPLPIVGLNRITILLGVIVAVALRAPWITTALFLVVALAAAAFGRASLIYAIGSRVLFYRFKLNRYRLFGSASS